MAQKDADRANFGLMHPSLNFLVLHDMHAPFPMTRSGILLLHLVFLPILVGCSKEIGDTEGRNFAFECRRGNCTLTLQAPDDATKQSAAYVVQNEGRILLGCPADNPAFQCRALTCEDSSPCSRLGGSDFLCEKGLCQAPERKMTSPDRLALCLAGTGEWKRTPDQVRRFTLAAGCEGDCVIPAACRTP